MGSVSIVRGDFGETYQFIIKNRDYSSYSGLIYVQSSGGTVLVDGTGVDSVAATDGSKNTLVKWTPASGVFGTNASLVDYLARIRFSGSNFRATSELFKWEIEDELMG